jgi:hypothetical protein
MKRKDHTRKVPPSKSKAPTRAPKPPNLALIPRADMRPADGGAGRIAQILLNVDLRNGPDGLMKIARERGIREIPEGSYLVCVNAMLDRFITLGFTPRGVVVAYYKSFQGRIVREDIESLPAAFGVRKKFQTSTAMAEKLDEELKYKRLRNVTPD